MAYREVTMIEIKEILRLWALIGSANFTGRGTDRNIEAGVLLHSPEFARTLLAQWEALISRGLLQRVDPNKR